MIKRSGPAWRMMAALSATLILTLPLTSCATSDQEVAGAGASDPTGAVLLRDPDGGTEFFGQFTDGLPSSTQFIPIGVWSESVVDDTGWPRDKGQGINTYVAPTPNSDLSTIARAGMYALPVQEPGSPPIFGPGVAGVATPDEIDMWAGPGNSAWSGNYPGTATICDPPSSQCGYTVLEQITAGIPEGRMVYTNYGKGIVFWESDEEARHFVNEFQDVLSADTYWFTDPYICGPSEAGALYGTDEIVPEAQCRLAANYGATVARVRSLVEPAGSKPIWNFVEVGAPFTSSARAITGPEIRAAAWSGLINGARGIVYFNHSFGGSCQTQHVLRDCDPAITAAVTELNAQITRLAPVLNAPFADHFVAAGDQIDATAKLYDGQFYVLAGSKVNAAQDATFTVACGGATTAVVVDENRQIPIVNGTFTDHFDDGNTVHIYRLTGGGNCGLK